ncbi:MAG: hypothetical protein J0H23_01230 [Micrococcales bacterium]|mgnify:CR=1 FL=1|nr:hypothetical protein [Micrococcales bacterium]
MPRPREALPEEWMHAPFRRSEALARGVTPARLDASDLSAPFQTVRAPAGPLDPARIAAAYALRQGPDQAISHTSALLLWGAPLPRRVETAEAIHVSSIGASRPRTRLTIPHLLQQERVHLAVHGELVMTDAATSWVQSAPLLGLDDLVAAGDFLITGTEPFDGASPLVAREDLHRAIVRNHGARGIRRAREALELIRYGPLSRRESFLHLMMRRGNLPPAELNHRVRDDTGREVHMVDAAHVRYRVATEFESLLHLDPAKFRRDIRKQQELAAIGWATHRLTSDDVDPRLHTPASRAAIARIRSTLLERGWDPTRE